MSNFNGGRPKYAAQFTVTDPNLNPADLFNATSEGFFNKYNSGEILVYTDGSCLRNGSSSSSAGCGIVYGDDCLMNPCSYSFALEKEGPTGEVFQHTSNRAELRAAIAALQLIRRLYCGLQCIVIATDSEYVFRGATSWAISWEHSDWTKRDGNKVENRDLWEALLKAVRDMAADNVEVAFWRIPREWNRQADHLAKQAAERGVPEKKFRTI